MKDLSIKGQIREPGSKGKARRLRMAGKVPGVIYGKGDNLHLSVDVKDIHRIVDSPGRFLSLIKTDIEGDSRTRYVMIKDLAYHPITDTFLHVDFIEIDVDKKIKVSIDIILEGSAKGVKEQGGTLLQLKKWIDAELMPKDIIPSITLNVSKLKIGDSIKVKDLQLSSDIAVLDDLDTVIAEVFRPRSATAESEEATEEGQAAEGEPESSK